MFWLDLSACYAGCYTDTDRTISVGEPTAGQREIYDVVAEMYRVLLDGARAGVAGGELWEKANRVAADGGLRRHLNHVYLGHTTGITTSSRPVVARGETAELVPGSFLNLEPGIFVPGVGPPASRTPSTSPRAGPSQSTSSVSRSMWSEQVETREGGEATSAPRKSEKGPNH